MLSHGGAFKEIPPGYKVPRNLTVNIGLPTGKGEREIRLAYTRSRDVTHEVMEFAVTSRAKPYQILWGFTQSRKKVGGKCERVLYILHAPDADIERMRKYKIPYIDPRKSVDIQSLQPVVERLDLDCVEFSPDPRWSKAISEAVNKSQREGRGVEALIMRHQKTTSE